jgi:hypothetical protein
MKQLRIFIVILFAAIFSFTGGPVTDEKEKFLPAKVFVKKSREGFQLYRNGAPYFIKGAGGYEYFDLVKKYGGNSVRLWSTGNAKEYLDAAFESGLTVTLGLDLGLERRGFNYDDKKAVSEQYEKIKKEVLEFKDHPALLMWAVGNELDQFAKNYKVWNAVNDLARFIHEADPNHPVTTMLAGVPENHIKEITRRCPELDILSINAFKDLPYVREKVTNAGWKGPYLIGEWGASGYWESDTVPWGTFIEETSSEKAQVCTERYEKGILANADRCVGAYVFYWGYKQARTHTLLSLFLETGEQTETIDVLQKHWSGNWPSNRCPQIAPIGIGSKIIQKGIHLKPGSKNYAYTDATDPDKDSLIYKWEIYPESKEKKEGGDKEEKPRAVDGLILEGTTRKLCFKAPAVEGAYRLFVYVSDRHGHAATANAPFYVSKN